MKTNYELEYLRLEVERLKNQLNNITPNVPPQEQIVSKEDMVNLLLICDRMKMLLIKCRNQQINYKLAKEIDYLLAELNEME